MRKSMALALLAAGLVTALPSSNNPKEPGRRSASIEDVLSVVSDKPSFSVFKPEEIKDAAVMISAEWCVPCVDYQRRFKGLFNREYANGSGDANFLVSKENARLGDRDVAELFRESLGIDFVPSWAVIKDGKVRETGKRDGSLEAFRRAIDLHLFGKEHEKPVVEKRLSARYFINESPSAVIDALTAGMNPEDLRYENGSVVVPWDLSEPEQFRLALKNDSSTVGVNAGYLLRARRIAENAVMERRMFDFPEEDLRYLVRKYFPEREEEVMSNQALWKEMVGGGESDENLFGLFSRGDVFDKENFRNLVKKSGLEGAIKDRKLWYKMFSSISDSELPDEIRTERERYVEDARKKFRGKFKRYEFLSGAVSGVFRDAMGGWALEQRAKGNNVSVEYMKFPSDDQIGEVVKEIGDKSDAESYGAALSAERDRRISRYADLREKGVMFVPHNAPEEVLWKMVGNYDASLIARQGLSKEWTERVVSFAEKNRDLGIFVLGRQGLSLGFAPPFEVGIEQAIMPYIMAPGIDTGAVLLERGMPKRFFYFPGDFDKD